MRKKLMALLLAASMVVGMTACGSNKNGGSSTNSASKVSGEYDEKEFNGIKYKKAKDITNFQRQEQSIHPKNSLSTGLNYAKNIRSSPSKTVWMKKTGKDGRNLQQDLATKYSLSVMTCLLQIQKDLQKVSALAQVMRS